MNLSLDEAERVLAWGNEHSEGLKRHKSWLKDFGSKTLPGAEIAVAEIERDINRNYNLMTKLYEYRNELRVLASERPSASGTLRRSAEMDQPSLRAVAAHIPMGHSCRTCGSAAYNWFIRLANYVETGKPCCADMAAWVQRARDGAETTEERRARHAREREQGLA